MTAQEVYILIHDVKLRDRSYTQLMIICGGSYFQLYLKNESIIYIYIYIYISDTKRCICHCNESEHVRGIFVGIICIHADQ